MRMYKIKLKCGHECEVEMFGDEKTHAKELADCERTLPCPACFKEGKNTEGWEVVSVKDKPRKKGRVLH